MRNRGLGAWPARRARRTPERVALVHGEKAVTYAELADRVCRLAHGLRALGVERGDRVAYLGPNVPSLIESLLATNLVGAVFVPLNTRLSVPELMFQVDDCGASALIAHGSHTDAAQRLVADRPGLTLLTDDGEDGSSYERLIRRASRSPIDEPISLEEPAMILYTSGTTGKPKGATLTHGNVTWNCFNVIVDMDIHGDEVTLVSAPLFHVAALNMSLLPTLLKGGTAVLMASWDVDRCFDLIGSRRVTSMFGVPSMFAGLSASPRWATADLSSVRLLLAGGAPVPPELIETYLARGLRFLQGFGMTEASPGTMLVPADQSVTKVGAAGVPHFFTDVRVVRDDLEPADVDEPGEILIHGPNVMSGYWNRPDATDAVLSDGGWLHSGDVARVDADGYIYVIDRLKDMYVSGGENVYPAEVEAVLGQHPSVAEVAVIGIPDERWGEVGRAFVRATPDTSLDEAQLLAFLDGRLARYKWPRSIVFVPELPRTGSGKLAKQALRG